MWSVDGMDFPCSWAGKESICNEGDSSSIPGYARSTGEGIGYPPQYPWASLMDGIDRIILNLWLF